MLGDVYKRQAIGGIAQEAPHLISVVFSAHACTQIERYAEQENYTDLALLIRGVLGQDPRPAYKKAKDDPKLYQVALYDLDVFWQMAVDDNEQEYILVLELKPGKCG